MGPHIVAHCTGTSSGGRASAVVRETRPERTTRLVVVFMLFRVVRRLGAWYVDENETECRCRSCFRGRYNRFGIVITTKVGYRSSRL